MAALGDAADAVDAIDTKPLESLLGDLLIAVAATISDASQVSVVIASLHPLASLFFTLPENLVSCTGPSGSLGSSEGGQAVTGEDCEAESQLVAIKKLSAACRRKAEDEDLGEDVHSTMRNVLYRGSLFSTLTTLLLHQVALDWLICFPSSVQRWLFDEFFRQAPAMESLLNLAPFLSLDPGRDEESDLGLDSGSTISAQAKRLLDTCLLQQHGVKEIALLFGCLSERDYPEGGGGNIGRGSWHKDTCQVGQLVATIPDRATLKSPAALQSPAFYESISRQLVSAGEERWDKLWQICAPFDKIGGDGTFEFIGDVISRLCRRGHADVIASVCVPALAQQVELAVSTLETKLSGEKAKISMVALKAILQKSFWPVVTASIKEPNAMEKWVESLLKKMADKDVSDMQAYCILWMAFDRILSTHTLIRMVFLEKLLFVKILPIRCLRWIIQFAVLHCPPTVVPIQASLEKEELYMDTDVVKRLAQTWSSNDFIRSASLSKQAYLTAAVGICVRKMNKEDMEKCGDMTRSILQGITNRLESPLPLVREMAKRLALAFSLVINPAKPLLLDNESEVGDLDDWDFLSVKVVGSVKAGDPTQSANDSQVALVSKEGIMETSIGPADKSLRTPDAENHDRRQQRRERRERLALEEDDPDAVVTLGEYNVGWYEDDEGSSEGSCSDNESEGSLQPYDMSDDDSELERRKFPAQLRICAANLRKPDDPDTVERALKVAESLIRAMPIELDNAAEDLAQALVHVRCTSIAVEGEEDTVEQYRHRALVALLACAPLSCIVLVTQEIFSPHVDISQRLLLLDVMSDAALELAGKKVATTRGHLVQRGYITELVEASNRGPWYGPGHHQLAGAGPWSEVPAPMPGNSLMGWAQRYERELPARKDDRKLGKSRTWAPQSMRLRQQQIAGGLGQGPVGMTVGENLFAPLAAAFMLPIMRDYDKKSHGVDFLNSGFIVLGKLLYTLGICIECITAQPEAPVLGAGLLNLLQARAIANHPEAYVRRAALYAASRVIVSLHPSQVVTALTGLDSSIATGLEWVREWALGIANNDPDADCSALGMACIQLHSEMAMQAMRAIQTLPSSSQSGSLTYQKNNRNSIILPFQADSSRERTFTIAL